MSYYTLRTTAYSLILVLSTGEFAFSAMTLLFNVLDFHISFLNPFSAIAIAMSLTQSIWICTLLGYNNKPRTSHSLSQSKTHLTSCVVFGLIWLGLSVWISVDIPTWCETDYVFGIMSSCDLAITETALCWLLWSISTSMSIMIFQNSKHYGLDANISIDSKTHLSLTSPAAYV